MIGDTLFGVVLWFANALVSIFPPSTGLPAEMHEAAITFGSYFGMFDALIPMETLFACLTIVFGAEIAVFSFRTLKWAISHLPFIGGRG